MAPSLVDPSTSPATESVRIAKSGNKFGYEPGRIVVKRHESYAHEDLLPSFPDQHWAPLEAIPYNDRGLLGDPKFRNLLRDATAIFDYTPKIGTEIHGIRLTQLSDTQKDDLARLIAVRGVVFFRQQDDFDIEAQRALGKYFGQLHKVARHFHVMYSAPSCAN